MRVNRSRSPSGSAPRSWSPAGSSVPDDSPVRSQAVDFSLARTGTRDASIDDSTVSTDADGRFKLWISVNAELPPGATRTARDSTPHETRLDFWSALERVSDALHAIVERRHRARRRPGRNACASRARPRRGQRWRTRAEREGLHRMRGRSLRTGARRPGIACGSHTETTTADGFFTIWYRAPPVALRVGAEARRLPRRTSDIIRSRRGKRRHQPERGRWDRGLRAARCRGRAGLVRDLGDPASRAGWRHADATAGAIGLGGAIRSRAASAWDDDGGCAIPCTGLPGAEHRERAGGVGQDHARFPAPRDRSPRQDQDDRGEGRRPRGKEDRERERDCMSSPMAPCVSTLTMGRSSRRPPPWMFWYRPRATCRRSRAGVVRDLKVVLERAAIPVRVVLADGVVTACGAV